MIIMKDMGKHLKDLNYLGYSGDEYVVANKHKKQRTKSASITEVELLLIYKDLKNTFKDSYFSNSDLKDLCSSKWNLTNRQTPSRLKKLYEQGLLERESGSSPYRYKIKK